MTRLPLPTEVCFTPSSVEGNGPVNLLNSGWRQGSTVEQSTLTILLVQLSECHALNIVTTNITITVTTESNVSLVSVRCRLATISAPPPPPPPLFNNGMCSVLPDGVAAAGLRRKRRIGSGGACPWTPLLPPIAGTTSRARRHCTLRDCG